MIVESGNKAIVYSDKPIAEAVKMSWPNAAYKQGIVGMPIKRTPSTLKTEMFLEDLAKKGEPLPTYQEYFKRTKDASINPGSYSTVKKRVERAFDPESQARKPSTKVKLLADSATYTVVHTIKDKLSPETYEAFKKHYVPAVSKFYPNGTEIAFRKMTDPDEIEIRLVAKKSKEEITSPL